MKVGDPIAYVTETKEQYDQLVSGGVGAAASEPEEKGRARNCPTCVHTNNTPEAKPVQGRISASGFAKKTAREAGIDLADVAPTDGPTGRRIVAKDVEAYLSHAKTAWAVPAAPAAVADDDEVTEIPWGGIRRTIARNMFNSTEHLRVRSRRKGAAGPTGGAGRGSGHARLQDHGERSSLQDAGQGPTQTSSCKRHLRRQDAVEGGVCKRMSG